MTTSTSKAYVRVTTESGRALTIGRVVTKRYHATMARDAHTERQVVDGTGARVAYWHREARRWFADAAICHLVDLDTVVNVEAV